MAPRELASPRFLEKTNKLTASNESFRVAHSAVRAQRYSRRSFRQASSCDLSEFCALARRAEPSRTLNAPLPSENNASRSSVGVALDTKAGLRFSSIGQPRKAAARGKNCTCPIARKPQLARCLILLTASGRRAAPHRLARDKQSKLLVLHHLKSARLMNGASAARRRARQRAAGAEMIEQSACSAAASFSRPSAAAVGGGRAKEAASF